jgi:ATP-binding cassette, subfamily B, bacterial HlyB/CyaB
MDAIVDTSHARRVEDRDPVPTPGGAIAIQIRLMAVAAAARFHGTELDATDLRRAPEEVPTPAALANWVRSAGLWSKAVTLSWKQVVALSVSRPVPLLLKDGSAVLLVATDRKADHVFVRHSRLAPDAPPVALRKHDLTRIWSGEALLVRSRPRKASDGESFNFGWIVQVVWQERHAMRDVLLASLALSILTIVPPLMVMAVVDQAVVHQSLSTLVLMSLLIGAALVSESMLGYSRRQLVQLVGARVDAKLNLHVFERLLRLPMDFLERNQSGVVWSRTGLQVGKIRDFLTGRLLSTMLDLVTLVVLLPILFYLQPTLSWAVLSAAGVIAHLILAFMQPMSRRVKHLIDAETAKSSLMVETLHGMRTVKSLALEPQQTERWDERVAAAVDAKLAVSSLPMCRRR